MSLFKGGGRSDQYSVISVQCSGSCTLCSLFSVQLLLVLRSKFFLKEFFLLFFTPFYVGCGLLKN